jgi:hypothetical protein
MVCENQHLKEEIAKIKDVIKNKNLEMEELLK